MVCGKLSNMHMLIKIYRYSIGLLKNLFNPAISLFARIDPSSHVDRKAKIYGFTKVYHSKVGAYTYIGRNSSIVCAKIGNFCSIAGEVIIGMGNHTLSHLSTSPIFTERVNGTGHEWTKNNNLNPYSPVEIGNDVWIGERAIIMGGVKVGDGVVIGAGAIVTRDIPPYAIVVGVPAKIKRYRFNEDIISYLEKLQWWNMSEKQLKNNIHYFQGERIDISELRRFNDL